MAGSHHLAGRHEQRASLVSVVPGADVARTALGEPRLVPHAWAAVPSRTLPPGRDAVNEEGRPGRCEDGPRDLAKPGSPPVGGPAGPADSTRLWWVDVRTEMTYPGFGCFIARGPPMPGTVGGLVATRRVMRRWRPGSWRIGLAERRREEQALLTAGCTPKRHPHVVAQSSRWRRHHTGCDRRSRCCPLLGSQDDAITDDRVDDNRKEGGLPSLRPGRRRGRNRNSPPVRFAGVGYP